MPVRLVSVLFVGADWRPATRHPALAPPHPWSRTPTKFECRSMDKYQEPFTMPASFSGALETQRGTIDLTETVITSRMGLYLAAGVAQKSTVKVAQFGIRKV
ncbi:hypothetical protein ALP05_05409 [Pseudomonas caricapapayae]|uniref:Uncharacterized protein n=1 Tax=Pseudomonas caricapapayae TaxID=46678 RepID=A0A3M6EX59_9PSED|nr:hypothetical protein ALP05_05409 [Pseudomonas caricapapayae]